VPMPVQRTMMAPPRSRIGAITPEERASVRARSPIGGKYDTAVNRESAYEILRGAMATAGGTGAAGVTGATGATGAGRNTPAPPTPVEAPSKVDEFLWGTKRRQGMVETMAKQTARTVGSQLGRQILRGLLGGILGSKRTR
jgi:DNA double-strand break repair helicase HerA and related ATPase